MLRLRREGFVCRSNLVGPATLQNEISVDEFLYTVGWEVVISPYFNLTDWSEGFSDYTYTDTPMVQMGQAYWVYLENPDELLGFTSTPLN
jgi:hypothetical protein